MLSDSFLRHTGYRRGRVRHAADAQAAASRIDPSPVKLPRTAATLALALSFGCGQGMAPPLPPAAPRCGDGIRQPNEECDLGAANGPGSACQKDCTWTCIAGDLQRGNARCDPHDACKGRGACGDDHVCRAVDPLPRGAFCGDRKICRDGACSPAVCGDGIVTAPEECDDGTNDGSGGCGPDCRFSCVSSDPARSCAPADPCQGPSACDDAKHTCAPRTPLADGTSCGAGQVCRSGRCLSGSCGDGVVDGGEECDPPDGVTCDATCHRIGAAVCGNGVREAGEQCDDGNLVNLDGCDSSCRFEQAQRANAIQMKYATDAFCTANALGEAIAGAAQSQLQSQLDKSVATGAITMAFQALGLADLGGTNAASFTLGAVAGAPFAAPPLRKYDGSHDLDWWYQAHADDLDAQRIPKAQLAANIASKVLHAGPGRMNLMLSLGAGPVQLAASAVRIQANVGAASAPTVSTAATPGHPPSEHLDPALVSFDSLANGELCGNVSAASLAQLPAPQSLQSGGSNACGEGYGPSNTMLDVIVGGCSLFGGLIPVIVATQPDRIDPDVAAAGAGGPYTLTTSGPAVSGCNDRAGAPVSLQSCLASAAYSSFVGFSADRVVLK